MIKSITKYFSSVKVEMKKVTWLSKDELISSTFIVGIFSVVMSIFLFLVDFSLSEFMSVLIGG